MQANFSVGEVSPDLVSRSTLENQRKGVQVLTNFYTDSRGPVVRRKGFRYLGTVGVAGPRPFVTTMALFDEASERYEDSPGCVDQLTGVASDRSAANVRFIDNYANSPVGHLVFYQSGGINSIGRYDGSTWSNHTVPTTGGSKSGVVWWIDRYILIWYQTAAVGIIVQESLDGQTWTNKLVSSSNAISPSSSYNALATDGITLAFCGTQPSTSDDGVWYSIDGLSWTFSNQESLFGGTARSMFYVNGFWWVGTFRGKLYKADQPQGPYTQVMSVGSLIEFPAQLVYGDGKYKCIVTEEGFIYTSTTGNSFSEDLVVSASNVVRPNLTFIDNCGFVFVRGAVKKFQAIGTDTWVDFASEFNDLRGVLQWDKPA